MQEELCKQRPEYILKILEGRDKNQQLVTGKGRVLQVIDPVSYVSKQTQKQMTWN